MKAIFAGTFDPFTLGHADIALRALKVFGNVTVAVHADARSRADASARVEIARLTLGRRAGVEVDTFSGLLTDYVKARKESCVLVRGLRSVKDFDYERELDAGYKSLADVESAYFITDPKLLHVSSTSVRELAALGAPLDGYIAAAAIETTKKHYGN